MANTFFKISNISFVLMLVFCLLAVFFLFRFRILDIIGDLSGRTAKKTIERMREENKKMGNKLYRPSNLNSYRGKTTEPITENENTVLLENTANENVTQLLDLDGTAFLRGNTMELSTRENKDVILTMIEEVVRIDTQETM